MRRWRGQAARRSGGHAGRRRSGRAPECPGVGFLGDLLMVDADEVGVRRDEAGEEGVVLGGEAELPAAPVNAASCAHMAGGDAAVDEIHAEGLLNQLDARGERKDALDGCVDPGVLGDEEWNHTTTTPTRACSPERTAAHDCAPG